MDDCLFHDAHHALYECFAIVSQAVAPQGTLGRMMKSSRRSSQRWAGLSPLEKHAQAAQVVAIVEKMPDPAGREYLIASFAGFREGAMSNLVNSVIGTLPTGVHQRRGIQSALKAYFGAPVSARSLRYDLHCKQTELPGYRKAVGDAATIIGLRAMEYVEVHLERKGLIPSAVLEEVGMLSAMQRG